ncbi:uncharacterized protein LOC126796175 [Argentina anserina]|uniref:uncharacterized protein LOC126796175 n=1 Tax=Argentina anserina TaxID=57926 RepID=UPI0021765D8C|nr:uncharacterized protein LOC126796175 [Potentilla anserina]
MGRKKPKDPETDAASCQPDIFKTLFGAAATPDSAPAIFSDDNPFRRKNQDPGPGSAFAAAPSLETASDGGAVEADNGEVKKRKKKAADSAPEAEEAPLENKRPKKSKKENPNLENDVVSNLVLGLESNTESDPNFVKRGGDGVSVVKKKRKRDELEREYEAKKYGVKEDGEVGKKVGEKRKTVDNPAETLVSEEGFDDESKLLRTVFVGNLPVNVKKKVLIREFSKFGEVESVRIRSVPIEDTKAPRKVAVLTKKIHKKADSVNAYIVFKSEESAQASLSHNMAVVEDHHIRVDRACPPRKKLKGENSSVYDHTRTVFVGNLPFEVKDEEVYQLFCGINNKESGVEAVRIIRDSNVGLGKGIAYVLFETKEAANAVVRKRTLKLRNRELRLSHAKPEYIAPKSKSQDSTPSKRSNLFPASNSKSPAKRLAVSPRTPEFKGNSKPTMSYQGVRAGKNGVQKYAKAKFESRPQSGVKPKERTEKRPSVAARKAKATLQGSAASKQTGVKRKMDSRTPESSHQKKKFKNFR